MRNNTLYLIFLFTLWTGILHGQYKNAWESLSGPITESPSVCSWGVNRLDVFVRGTDNALWTKSYNGNQWTGFSQLGNEKIASDPAAVSWGPNRINVFVRGTDNMLYTKSWENDHWTGYSGLSGPIVGGPAVCSSAPNHLRVFVRGTDNALWTKGYDGNQWGGFFQLGNEKIASDPAAVSWGPNRMDVFVRGTDNMLYTKSWEGDHWTGYVGLGGPINGSPAVCSQAPNRLDVFVRLPDNTIATKSWNGSQWSGFTQVSTDVMDSDPAAISWGANRMDVFARGTDAQLYHKWWNGIWLPVSIVEGQVYRETSHPEVYYVSDGKKIWVPTPDALFSMGYTWSSVIIVPDHTLDYLPRFNIPSSSATPGSLVFPPSVSVLKHLPIKGINTATKVLSRNKEIQIVELRGWLRTDLGDDCNGADHYDYHYLLELDTDWAIAQGIDIQKILRVGNIVIISASRTPGSVPRRMVSLPLINIEVNSWGWDIPLTTNVPIDWNGILAGCPDAKWPFNPKNPKPSDPFLANGQYIKISGSLVTDEPHEVLHRPGTFISRYLGIWVGEQFDWEGSVPDWHPGVDSKTSGEHYARWTEMHPPDMMEVIDEHPRTTTVRGLALCARVAATPGPIIPSCEEIEFDIYPEAPKPPNSIIAFQELRGPECFFPWGQNADNGTWITSFSDHIHVRAKICGGALFGSPGRIKALYRVWWEVGQNPQPKVVTITNRSNFDVTTRFYGSNDGVLDILTPLLGGTLNVPANATRSWTLPTGMNTVKVTFNGSNVRSAAAGETLFWDTDERLHIFNKSRKPITARFYNAGDLLRVGTLTDGEKIIQSNQDIFWRMPENITQVTVTFNDAFPQTMSRSGVFTYTEKDLLVINQSPQAVTVQFFNENDPLGLVQIALKELSINGNSNSMYTLPVSANKVKVRFRQFGKPDQVLIAELGATLSYDRNGNVTKN